MRPLLPLIILLNIITSSHALPVRAVLLQRREPFTEQEWEQWSQQAGIYAAPPSPPPFTRNPNHSSHSPHNSNSNNRLPAAGSAKSSGNHRASTHAAGFAKFSSRPGGNKHVIKPEQMGPLMIDGKPYNLPNLSKKTKNEEYWLQSWALYANCIKKARRLQITGSSDPALLDQSLKLKNLRERALLALEIVDNQVIDEKRIALTSASAQALTAATNKVRSAITKQRELIDTLDDLRGQIEGTKPLQHDLATVRDQLMAKIHAKGPSVSQLDLSKVDQEILNRFAQKQW